LPDGIFSNPKSQFWQILEGLGMEKDGIFYGHLDNTTDVYYIFNAIWQFSGNLVYISPVLVYCVKENLATLLTPRGELKKLAHIGLAHSVAATTRTRVTHQRGDLRNGAGDAFHALGLGDLTKQGRI
jgi:hypothetical protein